MLTPTNDDELSFWECVRINFCIESYQNILLAPLQHVIFTTHIRQRHRLASLSHILDHILFGYIDVDFQLLVHAKSYRFLEERTGELKRFDTRMTSLKKITATDLQKPMLWIGIFYTTKCQVAFENDITCDEVKIE